MKEVIVYGRGGQGAVTASQLLAIAAFIDGKHSQGFPSFGVERRGAPVTAFARIDEKPINIRSHIYKADYAIILDPTLIKDLNIANDMKKEAVVVINTSNKDIKINKFKVFTFDASSLANEIFKNDIVNTIMVAVFSKFTNEISKQSLEKGLEEIFEAKLLEMNKRAVGEVFK